MDDDQKRNLTITLLSQTWNSQTTKGLLEAIQEEKKKPKPPQGMSPLVEAVQKEKTKSPFSFKTISIGDSSSDE